MNKCLLVFIAFAAIVALVLYVVYMCNLHARVSRLENRAAPHLEIIEREIHGIGFYMRIMVGIAIFFCVGICVHYIAVFYPRFTTIEDHKNYVSSIGADYWGIIVGFMALLVTLLVGWQIFSTIKAREELRNARDEVERRFKERLDRFDKCCEERGKDIKKLQESRTDLEAYISKEATSLTLKWKSNEARIYFNQAIVLTLLADLGVSLDKSKCLKKNEKEIEVKFQYSMAYRYYFEALVYYAATANYVAMESCLSNMKICLDRLEHSNEKFEGATHEKCNKLYNELSVIVSEKNIDESLVKQIRKLHVKRLKIVPYNINQVSDIKVITVDDDKEGIEKMFALVRDAIRKREAEEAVQAKKHKECKSNGSTSTTNESKSK